MHATLYTAANAIRLAQPEGLGMRRMKTKGWRRGIVAGIVGGMTDLPTPIDPGRIALQTLIPCMRAAAQLVRSHPDCEEKRDPREIDQADEISAQAIF